MARCTSVSINYLTVILLPELPPEGVGWLGWIAFFLVLLTALNPNCSRNSKSWIRWSSGFVLSTELDLLFFLICFILFLSLLLLVVWSRLLFVLLPSSCMIVVFSCFFLHWTDRFIFIVLFSVNQSTLFVRLLKSTKIKYIVLINMKLSQQTNFRPRPAAAWPNDYIVPLFTSLKLIHLISHH